MNYKVITTNDNSVILKSLIECAKDLFEQENNSITKLQALSTKYSEYGKCCIIYENNQIIGTSGFYCNDTLNHIAFLSLFVIKHEYRKKDMGNYFMKQ